MKKISKLCIILSIILLFDLFPSKDSFAAEEKADKPVISLQSVNNGTGVKITIKKTNGAEGYDIFITNRENAYSAYLSNNGKYDFNYATIAKDGSKKRSYTINGLPEGKYSFKVAAYKKDADGNKDISSYIFSKEKTITVSVFTEVDLSQVKYGDSIYFGKYEQDGNLVNGKEPIEWIVLSNNESEVMLLSKYVLDSLPYNSESADVTWKDCSLRKWLNKVFYKNAFAKSEQKKLNSVKLDENVNDKAFLLSLEDIVNPEYGFAEIDINDINRRCAATEYAKAQGAWTLEKEEKKKLQSGIWKAAATKDGEPTCWWWLRSKGSDAAHASSVNCVGKGNAVGDVVNDTYLGVRPVICIKK